MSTTTTTTTLRKEALCFQCALRMSIMFKVPPPPPLQKVIETASSDTATQAGNDPILDDQHHARFTIVHETPKSAERYYHDVTAAPARGERNVRFNSTSDGMLAGEDAPRHHVTWLCVGCYGLYQFIDFVHAPAVAAEVRRSPFFDSASLSVNVNVNRCFAFTWLSTATRYFDAAGTMTERPRATATVPEEFSNFKDFYMSDLRARILQYLLVPHSAVVEQARVPGIQTYLRLVSANEEAVVNSGDAEEGCEEPPKKVAHIDACSSIATAAAAAASGTKGMTGQPKSSQAFTYNPSGEGVVCEVYCRHHPTESLVMGHMPSTFCSNKGGEILSYSVLYDHAIPYLNSIGWGETTEEDTRLVKREAATMLGVVSHANIYLMGSYLKMQRNLSQSPWFTNGARIGTFSLQEIIANPVLPFFFPEGVSAKLVEHIPEEPQVKRTVSRGAPQASPWMQDVNPAVLASQEVFGFGCYKFHSAGREDVDVRMLGTGRPFVLELVSPVREQFSAEDLRVMEQAINGSHGGSVEVSDLRATDGSITVRLARHSESKIKRYRCVVWSSRAITDPSNDPHLLAANSTKDLTIQQKTPLRVLHRRSLHARPRMIHSMHITPINAHWFLMDVETQAGTYVKEFVHGDMGRTQPNLGTLLNSRTDIIQLDVVGMAMQDLDSVQAVVEEKGKD